MIHSGAVVAAGVSQGSSTTFGFDLQVSDICCVKYTVRYVVVFEI